MNKVLAILLLISMIVTSCTALSENNILNNETLIETCVTWLKGSYEKAISDIQKLGYKHDTSIRLINGFLFTKDEASPKSLALFGNADNDKLTGMHMIFSPNAIEFTEMYNQLNVIYGEGEIQDNKVRWETEGLGITLGCSSFEMDNYETATLFELQLGKYGFMVSMLDKGISVNDTLTDNTTSETDLNSMKQIYIGDTIDLPFVKILLEKMEVIETLEIKPDENSNLSYKISTSSNDKVNRLLSYFFHRQLLYIFCSCAYSWI